ncbi:MAG TPA: hypothetical protein VFH46_24145, partial [Pyrinomonadaceae bacterium]|nr:hypothetical protein [Pyrinomonadaceae bacterium]
HAMKRLFALALCGLLAISCSTGYGNSYSKGSTMTYGVGTQAELDQGKRGAIVVLSEYRQQHCRKFVTSEPRQSLPSALSR